MRNTYLVVEVLLLMLLQIVFWNFLNLSQLVVLCFLPAIILCLPIDTRPVISMLLAVAISFIVDFFSHGVMGLTAVALLPVAYLRPFIIRLVFGSELFARDEDISFARQGVMKMMLAVSICTILFFIIYVWVDSAGTRTGIFNLARLVLSSIVSILVSLGVSAVLTSERWR